MGWIGSADTLAQVMLRFATREEADAYAEKQGIAYDSQLPTARRDQAKGVRRQFPLRPHGELDALTRADLAAAPLAQLDRATAF